MRDPLKDLHNYSSDMTISQVVKFFKRQDIEFTKTMIQNYVRVGVLAPPDGRAYHAEHLKTLVMIEYLKPVYSLEEIRSLFGAMDVSACYDRFMSAFAESDEFWNERRAQEDGLLPEIIAFCAAAKRLSLELGHVE